MYAQGEVCRRPKGLNNKGVLNLWRQPKLAAPTVQTLFRQHAASATNHAAHRINSTCCPWCFQSPPAAEARAQHQTTHTFSGIVQAR